MNYIKLNYKILILNYVFIMNIICFIRRALNDKMVFKTAN